MRARNLIVEKVSFCLCHPLAELDQKATLQSSGDVHCRTEHLTAPGKAKIWASKQYTASEQDLWLQPGPETSQSTVLQKHQYQKKMYPVRIELIGHELSAVKAVREQEQRDKGKKTC